MYTNVQIVWMVAMYYLKKGQPQNTVSMCCCKKMNWRLLLIEAEVTCSCVWINDLVFEWMVVQYSGICAISKFVVNVHWRSTSIGSHYESAQPDLYWIAWSFWWSICLCLRWMNLVVGWMVWRWQEIWGHQYGFALLIQWASLLEGTWQGLMMSSFRFFNI